MTFNVQIQAQVEYVLWSKIDYIMLILKYVEICSIQILGSNLLIAHDHIQKDAARMPLRLYIYLL